MHRRTFALAGLAIPPALMHSALAAPRRGKRPHKPAKPRKPTWKVVTRTFSSPDTIVLSDGAPGPGTVYPSVIQVGGLRNGVIQNVSVSLGELVHEFLSDVDILLVAPNDRSVIVFSDVGVGVVVIDGLTFDDAAPTDASQGLASGLYFYKPTNLDVVNDPFPSPAPGGTRGSALNHFNGGNPNGPWRLFVMDDTFNDAGVIYGWSLTITARVKVQRKPKRKPKRKRNR